MKKLQTGFASVLILGFVVLIPIIFFLVPLPYYQSTQVVCKDDTKCPHSGWNIGATLYNQLFPKVMNGNPIETNSEQVNPPSEIATSNWKTYTNEKYGFSFQYPNDFSIENTQTEKGQKVTIWFPQPTGQVEQDRMDLTEVDQDSMYLRIEENPKRFSAREIIAADIRDLRKKDPTLQYVADKEEQSLKPYKNGNIDGVSFESGVDYDFDLIMFTHNSYVYTFSSTHYDQTSGVVVETQEIVTKIISSFKFLK